MAVETMPLSRKHCLMKEDGGKVGGGKGGGGANKGMSCTWPLASLQTDDVKKKKIRKKNWKIRKGT